MILYFLDLFKFHNSNNTDKYIIDKQATDDNALIAKCWNFDYDNDVDGGQILENIWIDIGIESTGHIPETTMEISS